MMWGKLDISLFGILIESCVDGLVVTTTHAHNKLSGFYNVSGQVQQVQIYFPLYYINLIFINRNTSLLRPVATLELILNQLTDQFLEFSALLET